MKVYIVLENGCEDGESIIKGVYDKAEYAQKVLEYLQKNIDPLDDDWLWYSLQECKIVET